MAKLSATDVSLVLAALPGCPKDGPPCGVCVRCRTQVALMGKPPSEHAITVGSLLSARTKQGVVELIVNDDRIQMDLDKAREIYAMLGGAIEAATTDQIVYQVFRDKGLPEEAVLHILMEMREKRQGSKGTVYPS